MSNGTAEQIVEGPDWVRISNSKDGLGVHRSTIDRMVKDGLLTKYKIGSKVYVSRAEFRGLAEVHGPAKEG